MIKIFVIIFILASLSASSQENIEIDGAITLGQSNSESPHAGTLRWQNDRLEVYNGIFWEVLSYAFDVGSVNDEDGNKYKTVMIGDTEWMIENLRTTLYNDKKPIEFLESFKAWENTDPGYCWPGGDSNNAMAYGALYNWYAVGTGMLCPTGWNVPTESQWNDLLTELGGNTDIVPKLQSREWIASASNKSGFSARPAGYRYWSDGIFYDFFDAAWFWSSTDSGTNATEIHFYYSDTVVSTNSLDKRHGYAVRCVR